MARLGRLPVEGDTVTVNGRTLTVASMDARRIARIKVGSPTPPEAPAPAPEPTAPSPDASGTSPESLANVTGPSEVVAGVIRTT